MFGYVKVYQPELKVREYEQYKGVYCSLCQTLGKRYSLAARMTLSYDFTFLSLFLMALREDAVSFCQGHCPFHPFKKSSFCCEGSSPVLDFAADVAMLLTYHKLSDTVADERFLKRTVACLTRACLKRDFRRAVERRPKEAALAQEYMRAQAAIEQAHAPSIDACAEPTAQFISALAVCGLADGVSKETVARFGYCLGRFIYLADAADDLENDLQSGSFNPYAASDRSLSAKDAQALYQKKLYAAQTLHGSVAVCAECYEQLPIKRFDGILRNILFNGMPSVIKRICEGQQEDQCHEESL